MKKLYILAIIAVLAIASTEALCSTVLISVELPTMESKKAWHLLGIPTYELIGNTAIAGTEEQQIPLIKQKGYQISVIDHQPDLSKYMVVSNYDKTQGLKDKSIWQSDKTAVMKSIPIDISKQKKYRHNIRSFNATPLRDRFWKNVTTKYVPLKNIPYDPLIQSLVDQVSGDSVLALIQRLQDFRTRIIFTDSMRAASQWVHDKYQNMGLVALYDSVYIDDYGVTGWERSSLGAIQGDGINKTIVLCGHLDSASWPPDSAPGADDDASGVAGAMEVARVLRSESWSSELVFAGWTGEEGGSHGEAAIMLTRQIAWA